MRGQAAVSLILRPGRAGGPELLLIIRARNPLDPWSGHMALPGGRREPMDKDLLATAIRETAEETGIRLSPRSLAGTLRPLKPRNRRIPRLSVLPHVFALAGRPRVRPAAEVAGHVWIPVRRLQAGACRVRVPERKVLVDAYLAGGRAVWGITRRILAAFLSSALGRAYSISSPSP